MHRHRDDRASPPNVLPHDGHRAVIVAMAVVLVMQVTINDVIDMVAVRNRFVTATGAMRVVGGVSRATMPGCAGCRIRCAHFQNMFFNNTSCRNMVKMAIVNVVDMPRMLNSRVTTAAAMNVTVVFVSVRSHDSCS